jgi:YaiO family outer membrane protein
MQKVLVFILCAWMLHVPAWSQEADLTYKTPEEGFALMRQLAANQEYSSAKQTGYQLLEEIPEYHDVSLYLARIYGWESSYDSAYIILDKVLAEDSTLLEAYLVGVDLAYWENDWDKLESYANQALEIDPDLPEVQEKLIVARQQEVRTVDKPEILAAYSYDHFSDPYVRNWHMLTAGAILPTELVTYTPYVNAGYQPGSEGQSTDIQFNLDAYINLGEKNSLMAGYGFSPSGSIDFLPDHRAALEYWRVLPKGFAVSAGLRYFYWDDHFLFYTLSGEKYVGNWWISLRTYLFSKDYGVSSSWYLHARRYLAGKHDYFSGTIGYGTAPDEPMVVVSDLDRLNALSFKLGYSKQLNPGVRFDVTLGYAYEEYAEQQYRNRYSFRTGFYFKIK